MIFGHSMGNRGRRLGAACATLALSGLFLSADIAWPSSAHAETAPIPLVPGLTIVAAVVQGGVDIEGLPFSVLVKGERTMLPAIHASGTLTVGDDTGSAEFWWLDQPDNPLTLRWTFQGDSVQVVRIDTPPVAMAAMRKTPPPIAPG